MISRNSITDAYPKKQLGDVVEFLDSMRRPVTESDRRTGQYPYYGANGLQGTIDDFIFDESLILLAEDGGHFGTPDRGIAYRVSGKTWVNNHAHVLRPKECVDLGFLCRVLENYDVTPWVTGTTRGKLTQAGAAQIVVSVPPLSEQRRIANILDKADALRAKRRAALAQLDTLTQSIFLDMVGDMRNNGRYPQHALSECAEVVSGVAKGRKLEGKQKISVPYLRVANVQAGFLDLSEIKTIEALPAEADNLALKVGDVVLTEGGDHDKLGRGAMWEGQVDGCIHQNHVFRVRPAQTRLLPQFFHEFLQTPAARAYFLRCAKCTTNLASINMTQLRALPVALPPINLQHEFVRRVAAVQKLKSPHLASLAGLDNLFVSLQQRVFRGDL